MKIEKPQAGGVKERQPVRMSVFPNDPNILLLYAPEPGEVVLPTLKAPFVKAEVLVACKAVGLTVRVTDDVLGKPMREIANQRKKDDRAERGQQQTLQVARVAGMLSSANSPIIRERAEIIKKKLVVDEQLGKLRTRLADSKCAAYQTGKYLPAAEFQAMMKRVDLLKAESQALQLELGALKRREKAENIAACKRDDASDARAFVEASKTVLDRETYLAIWAKARDGQIAEEDDEEDDREDLDPIDALACAMEDR